MTFNRISVIIVLSILVYACFLQALVFKSTKEGKEYESKIDKLNSRINVDSVKINHLELECERLEEENNILSSILGDYEIRN